MTINSAKKQKAIDALHECFNELQAEPDIFLNDTKLSRKTRKSFLMVSEAAQNEWLAASSLGAITLYCGFNKDCDDDKLPKVAEDICKKHLGAVTRIRGFKAIAAEYLRKMNKFLPNEEIPPSQMAAARKARATPAQSAGRTL